MEKVYSLFDIFKYQKKDMRHNHNNELAPSYQKEDSMLTHLLKNKEALAFMLGGNSTFTIKSLRTQKHVTFKVKNSSSYEYENGKRVKKSNPSFKFVSFLSGSDNEKSYTYMGYIRWNKNANEWEFAVDKGKWQGNVCIRRARVNEDTLSVKVFRYVFNHLIAGVEMPLIEFWSAGTCCSCGRTLTRADSIELSMGPVCFPRHQAMMAELNERIERRKQAAIAEAQRKNQQGNLFNK